MPTSIDWPLKHPRPRRRRFFLILAAIAVIVLGGRTALSYFVDLLWFRSLGYGSVFTKTLAVEWCIFTIFSLATFFVLYGSFAALKRTHLPDLPASHTIFFGGQPVKLPVEPVLRFIAFGGSIAISLVTGAGMMAEWPTLALFWYAPAAMGGVADPIFGKALNFFLFTLPACTAHLRLAAYPGHHYLHTGRFFHPHHRRRGCAHRPPQLPHNSVAWALHHLCVPSADSGDTRVSRPLRSFV